METYCVTCKWYTANENSSVKKTIQNRSMVFSNCAVCDKEKSTLLKIKKLIVFQIIIFKWIKSITNFYWMEKKEIMPELHLKQPVFTYSGCGPLLN